MNRVRLEYISFYDSFKLCGWANGALNELKKPKRFVFVRGGRRSGGAKGVLRMR